MTRDQIRMESVRFVESICSRDHLKFGLCESPTLQFDCFDVPYIKGARIIAQYEIDCSSLGAQWCQENAETSPDLPFPYYAIPCGEFYIDSCQRSSDMIQRKIVAYGRLAYIKWKLSDMQKWTLRNFYAPTVAGLMNSISIDSIIDILAGAPSRLMERGITENYSILIKEESSFTRSVRWYISFPDAEVDRDHETSPDVRWSDMCMNLENNCIVTIQKNYDKAYIKKMGELKDVITQLVGEIPTNKLNLDEVIMYSDSEARSNSSIITTENILEPKNSTITYISLYASSTAASAWTIIGNCFIPKRVVLRKLTTLRNGYGDPTTTTEDLFDTGTFNNTYKSAKIEIEQGTSAKVPIQKRSKTIKLEGTTTKNVTAYYHDLGKYFEANYLDEINAFIELKGELGKFDRNGDFDRMFVRNNFGLYPSETLYPEDAEGEEKLYPNDPQEHLLLSNYRSAWYDDEETQPYGRVCCTYTDTSGEEQFAHYDLVDDYDGNADKYLMYSLTDNYYIENNQYTETQVMAMLEAVADAIKGVQYMPAEIKAVGLPYVEAGDCVEVRTKQGGIQTIVLNRSLTGIQSLQDNLVAK